MAVKYADAVLQLIVVVFLIPSSSILIQGGAPVLVLQHGASTSIAYIVATKT